MEIENFKSFGGCHTIGPFDDFTAVIGPNGCGKSNLMDAISFVLGVSSKELRSNTFQDLVYHSSKDIVNSNNAQRKVQVSISLLVESIHNSSSQLSEEFSANVNVRDTESTDPGLMKGSKEQLDQQYKEDSKPAMDAGSREMIFKRKLVKLKGDGYSSVYCLDDKKVSHAEYVAMLKSLRIDAEFHPFLVFQGDIESIVCKKPRELTNYFEKISNSIVYEKEYDEYNERKRIAEENTIFAYQKKKGLLQEKKVFLEEKKMVEKFEKKQRLVKNVQSEFIVYMLYHVMQDCKQVVDVQEDCKGQLNQIKQKEVEYKSMIAKKKKQYSKCRKDKKDLEGKFQMDQVNDLKRVYAEMKETEKHLNGKRKVQEKKVFEWKDKLENWSKEMEASKEALRQLHDESDIVMDKANPGIRKKTKAERVEFANLREKSLVATNTMQQTKTQLMNEFQTEKHRLTSFTTDVSDIQDTIKRYEDEKIAAQDRVEKMSQTIVSNTQEIQEKEMQLSSSNSELEKDSIRLQRIANEKAKIQDILASYKDDLRETKQEKDKKNMVHALQRNFNGVKGRLIDLCKPKLRKYNMAVTIGTGKFMDAIVVETTKVAQECIAHLRERQLGTATFLPLDSIRNTPVDERLRSFKKEEEIHLLLDVIDCREEITPAVMYAISTNTIVCNNLDQARDLCFRRKENVKVVTLDGNMISKNKSMTGGKTHSDIARAKRWDDKEQSKYQDKLHQLEQEEMEIHQNSGSKNPKAIKERLETQLSGLKNRLHYAQADLVVTEKKLATILSQEKTAILSLQEAEGKATNLNESLRKKQLDIDQVDSQINEIQDEIFAAFSKKMGVTNLRTYELAIVQEEQEQLDRQREAAEERNKIQSRVDYLESQNYEVALKKSQVEFEKTKKLLEKLRSEQQDRKDSLKTFENNRKEWEKRLDDITKSLETVEMELKTTNKQKNALQLLVKEVQQQLIREDQKYEQLQGKKRSIIQKATLDFNLTEFGGVQSTYDTESAELSQELDPANSHENYDFNVLSAEKLEVVDLEDYQSYCDEYESSIATGVSELDSMQPNFKAIEKYDEVLVRLAAEEKNLEECKEESNQCTEKFEEIKVKRYQTFMNTFNKVSECIDGVYKELTKSTKHKLGGTAYLSLENNQEPFLHGMRYHAMPPMKRFREMDSLSGGEQTMAALAMIFAIHACHPSPFFVLDEIDAALDNINVNKVSHYIQEKCATNFQCIVISLKDIFYEKADCLVGICRDAQTHQSMALSLDLSVYE